MKTAISDELQWIDTSKVSAMYVDNDKMLKARNIYCVIVDGTHIAISEDTFFKLLTILRESKDV